MGINLNYSGLLVVSVEKHCPENHTEHVGQLSKINNTINQQVLLLPMKGLKTLSKHLNIYILHY